MAQRNPDGSPIHSILIDPRDARHMYFGTGSAGVFETTDQGASWTLLNTGMLSPAGPDPHPEYGYDPHCIALHPLAPDLLYQQNHCGIYRMHRSAGAVDSHRRQHAARRRRHRFCDRVCIRVIRTRPGCFRWTAPTCGREPAPTESRPCIGRATVVKPGRGSIAGFPTRAWYTVLRQSMAVDAREPRSVSTSARPTARYGGASTRVTIGAAWRRICRTSTHLKWRTSRD